MKFNKLAILGLAILLLFRADASFGQSNSDFEIITSENFNRIEMLSEFGSSETELNLIMSMDFNLQSNILAYGTTEELAFWNIEESEIFLRMPARFSRSIRFASNNSPLVAVAANQSIYIWNDIANPTEWWAFPRINGVSGNFYDIRVIGENESQEIIAVTAPDFGIFRWHVSTGELTFNVYQHYEDELMGVQNALLSEDGQIFALYGRSSTFLEFIDTNNGESLDTIEILQYLEETTGGVVEVNLLTFTESDYLLANLFSPGFLENSFLALINPHDLTVTQIEYDFEAYWIDAAISVNSNIVAIAEGFGGSVYFFNKNTYELVGLSPIVQDGMRVLAFSPDGRFIATGNGSGLVRLWGIPNEE